MNLSNATRTFLAIAVVFASVQFLPAQTQPLTSRFSPIFQSYGFPPEESLAKSIAKGKLTSSGLVDVVIADGNFGTYVFFNNGDGTFASPMNINSAGFAAAVAVGDVNLDGIPDVITFDTQSVWVTINHGDKTFAAPVPYAVVKGPGLLEYGGLSVGDVNNDGLPDIVLAADLANQQTQLQAFLNTGGGIFGSPILSTLEGGGAQGLILGDFDQDGKLDAAVTSLASKGVGFELAQGLGDGRFSDVFTLSSTHEAVQAADFNSDGKLDLALADTSSVSILLGNGNGGFTVSVHRLRNTVFSVTINDFNGDGKLDVAVGFSGSKGDGIELLSGNGDGTFGLPLLVQGHQFGGTAIAIGLVSDTFDCQPSCGAHAADIVSADQHPANGNSTGSGITTYLNR